MLSNPQNSLNSNLISRIVILATIAMWICVSTLEGTYAIAFFFGLFAAVMFLICSYLPMKNEVRVIFFTALFIRSLAAIIAFYSSPDPAFTYATGTNEDSIRFFENSFRPIHEVLLAFEEPGFPLANYYITQVSKTLGGAHYLSSIQLVLAFGAMFPAVVFVFVSEIAEIRVARVVGWLMVIHPICIAFSTGLMRDAIIGTFGWLLVAMVLMVLRSTGMKLLGLVFAIVVCGLALWSLRVLSCAGFLILALVVLILYVQKNRREMKTTFIKKLVVFSIFFSLFAVVLITRSDRLEKAFVYGEYVRSGGGIEVGTKLDSDGITSKLGSSSPLMLMVLSPVAIMQPIPFYKFEPPTWIGGPARFVDVLIGFGGLMNQLFIGMYVAGLIIWFRQRDWAEVVICGLYLIAVSAANIIGLGQVRFMMIHVFPIFYLAAVFGWNRFRFHGNLMRANLAWLVCLFMLYITYWCFKAEFSLAIILLVCIPVIAFFLLALLRYSIIASYSADGDLVIY